MLALGISISASALLALLLMSRHASFAASIKIYLWVSFTRKYAYASCSCVFFYYPLHLLLLSLQHMQMSCRLNPTEESDLIHYYSESSRCNSHTGRRGRGGLWLQATAAASSSAPASRDGVNTPTSPHINTVMLLYLLRSDGVVTCSLLALHYRQRCSRRRQAVDGRPPATESTIGRLPSLAGTADRHSAAQSSRLH
jgi:hypothetical protein